MSQDNVRFVLREFGRLTDGALEKGQEVHFTLHLGNYDEPGDDGCARNRLDGSAVFTVIIDPLPPNRHTIPSVPPRAAPAPSPDLR